MPDVCSPDLKHINATLNGLVKSVFSAACPVKGTKQDRITRKDVDVFFMSHSVGLVRGEYLISVFGYFHNRLLDKYILRAAWNLIDSSYLLSSS